MANIIIGVLGILIMYFGANREKYTIKQKTIYITVIMILSLIAIVLIFLTAKDFLLTKMLIVNLLTKIVIDEEGTLMDALVRKFKLILIVYIVSLIELGMLMISYYAI